MKSPKNYFSAALTITLLVVGLMSLQLFACNHGTYALVRYIGMDTVTGTAFIYDENFNVLPLAPGSTNSSAMYFPAGESTWMRSFYADVITRDQAGNITLVTNDPDYSEINHHLVMAYEGGIKGPTLCGFPQTPTGAGSEFSDLELPGSYAYQFDGGYLYPWSWHFMATPGAPGNGEEVYIQLTFTMDDVDRGYTDLDAGWLDVGNCSVFLCVDSGNQDLNSFPVPIPVNNKRLVAAFPHLHDHAQFMEIRHNGQLIHTTYPANANIPTAHDDCGGGATPTHSHPGHLPPKGLTAWTPGAAGPLLSLGDTLQVRAVFDNPHPVAIDNMAFYIAFWGDAN